MGRQPVVDIVVPTFNQHGFTAKCFESIRRTSSPAEVRVVWVDNGSDRAERDALLRFAEENLKLWLRPLFVSENLGFIKATNAGVAVSTAGWVVLLNNDTEVPDKWLERLIDVLVADAKIGIVGPRSSSALEWQGRHPERPGYGILPTDAALAFFCAMLRREVIAQIGYLSEEYGAGFGDDNDYCERVKRAGWKLALRTDTTVVHHLHATFNDVYGNDGWKRFQDGNKARFRSKWGSRPTLPSEDTLRHMFSLSQESHPERSWVLARISDADKTIYDLGCGANKTLPRAIGVDLADADILRSVESVPYIATGTADVIISRHSIEHLLDTPKVLADWKRALRKGGRLILVVPDFGAVDTMHPVLSSGVHLHAFTRVSLSTLLTLVGMKVDAVETVVPDWSFGIVAHNEEDNHALPALTKKIRDCENFSFVKLGDGEMRAMLYAQGANCDGQAYSRELGDALRDAYKKIGTIPCARVTRWKLGMFREIDQFERELGIQCTEDHDLLLNRVGELTAHHFEFWKAIKESRRHKVFVGPARLAGVVDFLDVDTFVEVPLVNSFAADPVIPAYKDAIVLFSAGMASKVWIAKIISGSSTCVDCGSAFDPLFVGSTRTNQIGQSDLLKFYGPLLERSTRRQAIRN